MTFPIYVSNYQLLEQIPAYSFEGVTPVGPLKIMSSVTFFFENKHLTTIFNFVGQRTHSALTKISLSFYLFLKYLSCFTVLYIFLSDRFLLTNFEQCRIVSVLQGKDFEKRTLKNG